MRRLFAIFCTVEPVIDPNATSLDLEGSRIGDADAQALAAELPNSQLTSLDLGYNRIGDAGARALAAALPNSQLTSLNLGRNRIGNAGAQALAAALPNSQLTSLSLRVNEIGAVGAQALAAALPSSKKLTSLDLEANVIGDAGAQALADALPRSSLTSLDLEANGIYYAGAKVLAAALPRSSLTSLYLGYNFIGVAGAQALAAALPNSQLTSLSLVRNWVGAEGAQALAGALPNSQLTSLDLVRSRIDDAGTQALAAALPNSQLTSLGLGWNEIGEAGAQALADALPRSSLTSLNLEWNQIGEAGRGTISQAVQESYCIGSVNIRLDEQATAHMQSNQRRHDRLNAIREQNKSLVSDASTALVNKDEKLDSPNLWANAANQIEPIQALNHFVAVLQKLHDFYAEANALPELEGKPVYMAWLLNEIRSEVAKAQANLFEVVVARCHAFLSQNEISEDEKAVLSHLLRLSVSRATFQQEDASLNIQLLLERSGLLSSKENVKFVTRATEESYSTVLSSDPAYQNLAEVLFPQSEVNFQDNDTKAEFGASAHGPGMFVSVASRAADDIASLDDEDAPESRSQPVVDVKPVDPNEIELLLANLLGCAKTALEELKRNRIAQPQQGKADRCVIS